MKKGQRKRGDTNVAGLQPVPVPARAKSPARAFAETLRQCSSQTSQISEISQISKVQPQISLMRGFSWLTRARVAAPKPFRAQPLASALAWLKKNYASSATKRLRVAETVSLGEKRFVAILRVDGREFLIGGSASGVSLLTQITKPQVKKRSPSSRAKAKLSVMREVSQ
jgi:hypothetical protein